MFTRFVANSEKCRKYAFLGGPPRLLRYYKGGVIEIYYNTTRGGVFPIYYNITRGRGGGSLGTPNLYYVIYGRPLIWNTLQHHVVDQIMTKQQIYISHYDWMNQSRHSAKYFPIYTFCKCLGQNCQCQNPTAHIFWRWMEYLFEVLMQQKNYVTQSKYQPQY